MLQRVDRDEGNTSLPGLYGAIQSEPIVAAVAEAELETPLLPRDHPKWVKDALSVSQRARDLIARLPRIAVDVLTFWDHRIRSIVVGDSRVSVDPSGSYRLE